MTEEPLVADNVQTGEATRRLPLSSLIDNVSLCRRSKLFFKRSNITQVLLALSESDHESCGNTDWFSFHHF